MIQRRFLRGSAVVVLGVGALATACTSDHEADATADAAGQVEPAVPPDPATDPTVPPGGLAGERGSAGDNTGELSLDSARLDSGGLGPATQHPDTVRRLPDETAPRGGTTP